MASRKDSILEEIGYKKKEISSFLDEFLEEWDEEENSGRWRKDIRERLQEMVKEGKMVRGSLVIITHELYDGNCYNDCLKTAGAIELLHTGILMHDDIIDKDDYRRGLKTFQRQYRDFAEGKNINQEHHFGLSMGIAGGDVSFFLGQNLLARLDCGPVKSSEVQKLVFREFANVGLAEQVDIYAGYSSDELTEKEIIDLYTNKTARYTFSLPLKAGAVLADVDEDEKQKLYNLGKKLGVIFQLKDDELGLFGDEDKVGEDIGSDLDEDKKTIHRLLLLEKLPEDEEEKVREKLGTELSGEEREQITELMEREGVKQEVGERMEELAEEAFDMIEELELDEDSRDFLRDATKFCLERQK